MNNLNLLGQLTAPTAVGSGDLLGIWLRVIWLILFVAWLVVLILWLWTLMKYCKAYRDHQQRYGQPYNSPCEANERARISLQCFRGLGLLIHKAIKRVQSLLNAFGWCGFSVWHKNRKQPNVQSSGTRDQRT